VSWSYNRGVGDKLVVTGVSSLTGDKSDGEDSNESMVIAGDEEVISGTVEDESDRGRIPEQVDVVIVLT
jgi:hypothetical protein